MSLAALLATIAGIAYAGLAPLDFRPANEVEWLDPGPGLRFAGRGIVYSNAPLRWAASPEPGEVSVEVWVEPAEEPADRTRRIFSIFDEAGGEPLLIAQWKSGLVVRARIADESGARRYRELGALGLLFRDRAQYVAVASDAAGTTVFVDGREIDEHTNFPLIAGGGGFGGRIVLGNAPDGTASWRGNLLGVAIYDRALAAADIAEHHRRARAEGVAALADESGLVALYPFESRSARVVVEGMAIGPALRVPLRFERLRTQALQLAAGAGATAGAFGRDVLLNWLAFVPLGFFAATSLRRRRPQARTRVYLGVAVLLGASLSFAIELIQVQLPDRVSSAIDLLCNVGGSAVGAILVWRGPVARRLFPRGD